MARNRPGHRAGAHTDGRTGRDGPGAPYEPGAPRPQAHLNGAEYLITSSSDQRERSRAVAAGALQWGAGRGKAGPRQAAGRGSNQQPKKIEGAPFRALPLLLNKGRPVWVGQVLCWPSAPALVGSGGRQACSIAGSD